MMINYLESAWKNTHFEKKNESEIQTLSFSCYGKNTSPEKSILKLLYRKNYSSWTPKSGVIRDPCTISYTMGPKKKIKKIETKNRFFEIKKLDFLKTLKALGGRLFF